jgi:hypothetical protein
MKNQYIKEINFKQLKKIKKFLAIRVQRLKIN